MRIKCLKNWNENCSAVLLTVVVLFLIVLLKLQEEPVSVHSEIITSTEVEIASIDK